MSHLQTLKVGNITILSINYTQKQPSKISKTLMDSYLNEPATCPKGIVTMAPCI